VRIIAIPVANTEEVKSTNGSLFRNETGEVMPIAQKSISSSRVLDSDYEKSRAVIQTIDGAYYVNG